MKLDASHMKPSSLPRYLILASIFVGAAILVSGCSSRPDFAVDTFDVEQSSWDSLFVRATFKQQSSLSASTSVAPDVIVYTVFDARFDTLYVGDDGDIAIPDRRLLDRERLLIEVCGFYQGSSACEQRVLSASPKKVMADYEVIFPAENQVPAESQSFEKGEVELATKLYRQVFDASEWEEIRKPSGKELSILAYVEGSPEDGVRIPISRSRTSFVLSRYDGNRDFRYHIQSSLMDADSAVVLFDLYALTSSTPVLVDQQRIVLRSKSTEERSSEVRELVEQAAAQILERVSSRLGSRRAYVFINDWSFEAIDKAYKTEFELHWQDAFQGEWADMSGQLYVKSDGSDGSFRFLRGSERAESRWDDRIGVSTIELEAFYPNPTTEPDESSRRNSRRRN